MTARETLTRYRGSLHSYKAATQSGYVLHATKLAEWQGLRGAGFPEVSESDLVLFLQHKREIGNSEATIASALSALRHFFTWAESKGLIEGSPAADIPRTDFRQPNARPTLTTQELKRMWDIAPSPERRALVGLLGMCGLKSDEALALDVAHLVQAGDHHAVYLPTRQIIRPTTHVLLPPEVHEVLREVAGVRRAGPLLRRADGDRLDRRTANRWVVSMGKKAKIPFGVTQMTLTYSLRTIAISHGFSYIGVVRAVGEMHPSKSQRWLVNAPNAPDQHAALRLGQILFTDRESSLGLVAEASTCLHESDLPPGIATVAAAAALEGHLRALCRSHLLSITKPEKHRKIGTYVQVLRHADLITVSETQRIEAVQTFRDDAAHGRFERVSREDAIWTIRECREFINQHPLPASAHEIRRSAETATGSRLGS